MAATISKPKFKKIEDDVSAVLRRAIVDGNKLTLPPERLEPTFYKRVDKVLKLLGGKWNRFQAAHIFEISPAEVLAEALGDGKVLDRKKTFQFFETPAALARRMAERAGIEPGNWVLEPSAGRGAIADQIVAVMPKNAKLFVCEIDPINCKVLFGEKGYVGFEGSFFDSRWPMRPNFNAGCFDRIVMNPPFSNFQDVDHVRHAHSLLAPGGMLVTIMSLAAFQNETSVARKFRTWVSNKMSSLEDLPAGTFTESGTEVPAKLIVIQKGND